MFRISESDLDLLITAFWKAATSVEDENGKLAAIPLKSFHDIAFEALGKIIEAPVYPREEKE